MFPLLQNIMELQLILYQKVGGEKSSLIAIFER